MNATVRGIKLTIHSWELPSWTKEHLRAATAGALRMAFSEYFPEARVEIAYNADGDEPVLDPLTGKRTAKGAKVEFDVRGGTEIERHMLQHVAANTLEGVMRRVLQMFIEHDAVNRFRQMHAEYKRRDEIDEPVARGKVLT